MEQLALGILEKSKIKVIAEGVNGFKIELIEKQKKIPEKKKK